MYDYKAMVDTLELRVMQTAAVFQSKMRYKSMTNRKQTRGIY